MIDLHIGSTFEIIIEWMTASFEPFFDGITAMLTALVSGFESVLLFPHPFIIIAILTAIAWYVASRGVAVFSVLGFLLVNNMGLWDATIQTLALVFTSGIIALMIGIPLGIWASKNDMVNRILRPVMDFMQTMPAFVYLIPAVLFFRLGKVPGVIATLIFAMPPAVRLTNLGIRQVSHEIKEAAISYGSTPRQILFKAELPVALPTILAGINQTIMLALSMVVIAAMIGAGGLGEQVLKGITQLQIGLGFESGIAVVVLAIYIDRVTQALGSASKWDSK